MLQPYDTLLVVNERIIADAQFESVQALGMRFGLLLFVEERARSYCRTPAGLWMPS
jgi:hypothetical protein